MRSSIEVHNYLQSTDAKFEMVTLSGPVKDSAQMAELLGLEPSSIVKTLVLIADGLPLMVLVSGDRRANLKKIQSVSGAKELGFAVEKDVADITGFHSRSTPPVAWEAKAGVIADGSIPQTGVVYTAGGQPNVVLKIRVGDLIRITEAKLADIT